MKHLSILIVDDAPDVCALLALWLESHHTASVYTGGDALTAVTLLHFDLVITDIHMPDISGLDIIKRLRQSQPWVKILAISGGSRFVAAETSLSASTELGADGVLLKPFDQDRLLTAIKACLGQTSDTSYLYSIR